MTRKGIIVVVVIFLAAFAIIGLGTRGYEEVEALQSLEKAAAKIRKDFPGVKPLPPELLPDLMAIPETVLLIDAREPEEFAVSHLPGAVNLTTLNEVEEYLSARPVTPGILIVYGAIGFRSAKLAETLRTHGHGNVQHLEGSIFRWANEDRPLVDAAGKPATQVHPYNRIHGRLLKPGKKANLTGKS